MNAEEVKEYNKKEEKLQNNRENSEIILKWPVTEEIIASIIDATVKDTKNLINQLINDPNFSNEEKINKLKEIEREIQEEMEKDAQKLINQNSKAKPVLDQMDKEFKKNTDKPHKITEYLNKNKENFKKVGITVGDVQKRLKKRVVLNNIEQTITKDFEKTNEVSFNEDNSREKDLLSDMSSIKGNFSSFAKLKKNKKTLK
ncbi:hypothetical protein Lyticum_00814 [Lyticum sinuosum]|uniref:Uncharacterized protein n=1 Tax=Lyticum sinuosum TaxID=1332059 RepID=A0AAE5AHW1_9RICK|nr:hypothetical protein [Lyticum sinuosum]